MKEAKTQNAQIKLGKKLGKQTIGDLIFYIALLAWPILQFSVMYIGVNVNSFIIAFQKYEVVDGLSTTNIVFTGENFANSFKWLFGGDPQWTANLSDVSSKPFWTLFWNSIKSWFLLTGIGMPLGLLFAYYISRNLTGSKFFRVVLFMPSILSAMIMCGIFSWFDESFFSFANQALNANMVKPLLSNPQTRYGMVIGFNIWLGFGISVLMFTNTMAAIPPEIIEAGKIDGISPLREFWNIVLPHVYPTLSVFLITSIAGIFVNQYNIFTFYGPKVKDDPGMNTFGYWFFVNVYDKADQMKPTPALFPLAAVGLTLTMIAVPLTLGSKWLLNKIGPKED